ncbi:MAG: dihydroxyacetone kinase operon transcriptional regulator DhaR [Anaerolineae bacterium]
MQPTAYPIPYDKLAACWQGFVATGRVPNLDGFQPDPAIIRSWQRCKPRQDARATPQLVMQEARSLMTVMNAQNNLVTMALPYLEDMHQFVEGSGCTILLADSTGCIVALTGDPDAVRWAETQGFKQGVFWSETYQGTNGIGLALVDAMPSQVVGPEHYFKAHHGLTTTAAPIHHINGRILGAVAVVNRAEDAHPHTLGMVMTASRAIASQLQTEIYLEEANYRLTELRTMFSAIAAGVIAWNQNGQINHINNRAGEMLNIDPVAAMGQQLEDILELPLIMQRAIQRQQALKETEVTLRVGENQLRTSVTLHPIMDGNNVPTGYIALLRPIEELRKLVHQQVGSRATLTVDNLPMASNRMRPIIRQIRMAARAEAPVLLHGEVGVGKNHLAHIIHNDSPRANNPFISINCRAIPLELMVTEFLGYEKEGGHGQPSKFELAHGGTLVFDQIDSLSLEMQEALLHVINTGYVMRLGSTYPIPVNVRIIATTSADLERAVAEGNFSTDLYYRFGVFNIHIPPLRERVEDIPFLVRRYLDRIAQENNSPNQIAIEQAALDALCQYPWPGNVRELESALERAFNNKRGNIIRLSDLSDTIRRGRLVTPRSPLAAPVLTVTEAEREAILRAGWASHGKITEMARLLGMSRTTLWRKMKQYDLTPEDFRT